MATTEEKDKKCFKEEPQICFKLNENYIQIPLLKFDAKITEKLMKLIKDLDIGTNQSSKEDLFNLMNLNFYESKYKVLKSQTMDFKEIINCLKRDLPHDKFAQPKRPGLHSVFQNLSTQKIVNNEENLNQVITSSNEKYEEPMSIENSTKPETVKITSINNCNIDKLEKNKADLKSKTKSVQTEVIECYDLFTSDED